NIDYEKAPAGDGVYAITVTAESGGDTPITANLVWNLNNINDEAISWAGVESSASISETADVINQGPELATYNPIATLAPTDPDGAGFEYVIDTGKDQFWLFDISANGVLSLKYNLDYESAWYPPVVKTTIWGHGTGGGTAAGVGAGTTWLPHEFTLTIGDIGENDSKTAWSGTQPSLVTVNEDPSVTDSVELGKPPVAIATFAATDADGPELEYFVTKGLTGDSAGEPSDYFTIDGNGVLYLTAGFDYETMDDLFGPGYKRARALVVVRGTSGGDLVGDAVSDTNILTGQGDGWITMLFTLSIANVNDESISWAGVKSSAAISETADVENQELITDPTDYKVIATLPPSDADGDGFQYAIAGDQAYLFTIGTDGELKLKYNLDYESAWYPPVVKTTIWGHGTTGSENGEFGAGTTWLPHEFTLTILDGNDADVNEYATTWSGTPTTNFAISETDGVTNQGELTEANYKAIATFKPLDADGDGFEYTIDQSKDGWWLFDY
ncbi:MAG: cadherin repeat domain-containing protein, partial [Gammaproteobacteria bacterium]